MLLLLLSPLSDGGEDFMATADAVNSETTMVTVKIRRWAPCYYYSE
jgi:hypothetical protein